MDICDNIGLLYYLCILISIFNIISVILKNVSIVYNINLIHNDDTLCEHVTNRLIQDFLLKKDFKIKCF